MYPKVKFRISARKDVASFESFVGQADFDNGRSLQWAIFKWHPLLKKAVKHGKIVDRVFAEKYVKDIYRKNEEIASKNMRRYERDWRKKEGIFFEMTDNIFHGFPWPKGKYVAYATIWGMFPRFLDDKTFQVPMEYRNRKYIPVTIAHEMLHFMFYAYIEKNYPRYRDPEHNFFLWHISEIFNILVINSPVWFGVFREKNMLYPEHRKIVTELRKKYQDSSSLDVDDLIRDIHPLAEKMMQGKKTV